jgi:hypothetical protein
MKEMLWKDVTPEVAAAIVDWFDHPTFKEIVGPLLLAEQEAETIHALTLAQHDGTTAQAAAAAARAGIAAYFNGIAARAVDIMHGV